jgi:hypothetical protein
MTEIYNRTVPYDDFLAEVLPYVQDVPEFVATNAVKNAVIEFCRKTRYWQKDLAPLSAEANVANYPIETPEGTVLVDIVQAWYNGKLLVPKSIDALTRIYRTLDYRTLAGSPAYFTRVIEPEILLVPYPVEALENAVTLRAALAPTRDSTGADSSIFEHYLEDIAAGARGRLYSMHGQPFSDPQGALTYERKFRVACDKARIRADKSLTRDSTVVEFQRIV